MLHTILGIGCVVICMIVAGIIVCSCDIEGLAALILLIGSMFAGVILYMPFAGVLMLVEHCCEEQIAEATVVEQHIESVAGIERYYTESNGWRVRWEDNEGNETFASESRCDFDDSESWLVQVTTSTVTGGWEWIASVPKETRYLIFVPTEALYGNE